MDKFTDLQSFVKVVEAGSISGAATRMNIAKSAVSRRLTELEQRLGVQLFQRTTRKLNLTNSGQSFYERAIRILSDLDEAEQAVSQQHSEVSGRLRVAAPLSFGLMHLGEAICDFTKLHPQVQFDLDLNDREIDIVQEGFDVAIRIGKLADSSLIARPIAPIKTVVCASPSYLQQHGEPKTPEDLKQHACLLYTNLKDPDLWIFFDNKDLDNKGLENKGRENIGKEVRVRVPGSFRANNGDISRQIAVAGYGILRQPTFIAYKSIINGDLLPILTSYQWPQVNAYAIYPQTRHLSFRVRAFVDFLIDRFQGTPYWDECLNS